MNARPFPSSPCPDLSAGRGPDFTRDLDARFFAPRPPTPPPAQSSAGALGQRELGEGSVVRAVHRECRRRGFVPAAADPEDDAARADVYAVLVGLARLHERARGAGRHTQADHYDAVLRLFIGSARVAAWEPTIAFSAEEGP